MSSAVLPDHPDMSDYERQTWEHLQEFWQSRANSRGTPEWVASAGRASIRGAKRASRAVGQVVPEPARRAARIVGEKVNDQALVPLIKAMVATLELVDDWAVELNDPQRVIAIARAKGIDVTDITELSKRDLAECDQLLTRHTLTWRSFGFVEGGAMGALALIPVAGMPVSVTADTVVLHIMATSIATRVAYSYGLDAGSPHERDFVSDLVTRTLANELGKTTALNKTAQARAAAGGRTRWSNKLREDHVVIARLEALMAKWYPAGKVPVAHMSKALWVAAIIVGAGANAYTLGRVATHTQRYCQTRFLADKYGLDLPPALRNRALFGGDDPEAPDTTEHQDPSA